MVSWQEALEQNNTIKVLKMAPTSRPQFPQHNKRFSEDITTATLNGTSVSSALSSKEQRRRPLSFLPIREFMPTLCFYPKHLPNITLLPLPVTQSMGTVPYSHSRLCVPLKFHLFIYMTPMHTFLMCSQLFLKFEYLAEDF